MSMTDICIKSIPKVCANFTLRDLDEPVRNALMEFHEAIKRREKTTLVLSGVPGCGKTVAAAAFVRFAATRGSEYFKFFDMIELYAALIEDIRASKHGTPSHKGERMLDDALSWSGAVIDDLAAGQLSSWKRGIIQRIVHHRDANRLPTIYTTNLSIMEIGKKVDPRVASRLTAGIVYHFPGGDRRGK